MWSAVLDWTGFLARLGRDLTRQKLRRYEGCTAPFPTRYLSPTGLALSCDACGGLPYLIDGRLELFDVSSYRDVPDGGVIWMRIEALPIFNREMLPRMRGRFVLCLLYTSPSPRD